ncbi:MAG: hypothetical protein ABH885_07530, partial [Candidatus Omnitrophota bacterium]
AARRCMRYRRYATLFAVGATGCSEITFQMLTIVGFQVLFGYLYLRITLIIASFMIGLAAGTWLILKNLNKIKEPFLVFRHVQAAILLYPFLLAAALGAMSRMPPEVVRSEAGGIIFSCMPFIAGFAGGIQFPVAGRVCLQGGGDVGLTAGMCYAVDLIGAGLGAFVMCIYVIPVFGLYGAVAGIILLNLSALMLLYFAGAPVSEAHAC